MREMKTVTMIFINPCMKIDCATGVYDMGTQMVHDKITNLFAKPLNNSGIISTREPRWPWIAHLNFSEDHSQCFALLFPVFSTHLENFVPFSSYLKLSSANNFNLEESKICCLGKG